MLTQFNKIYLLVFVLVGVLLLAGCASQETEAPTATQTAEMPVQPTVPSGALAILPTPAPGTPELTASRNVNLRSGPGQNYPVLAVLAGSTKASLVGISPDSAYYAVSLPVSASGMGWVDANFSQIANAGELTVIQPPPVPPTADFVGPQPGDPQVTAPDVVYVRTGPGNQYPAYGIAQAGSKGLVFGRSEDGQWWAVRINPELVGKGHGWVAAAFVQAENVEGLPVVQAPELAPSIPPPPPAEGDPRATAVDYINVRSGPGLNYPILGVAAPGASAVVSGKSADGQWWQVVVSTENVPEGLAWVSASYVSTQNTDNVPVVEAPSPPPELPPGSGLYSCVLVSQLPADGTIFTPGSEFSMVWVIQNTGSGPWSVSDTRAALVAAANNVRLSSVDQAELVSDVPAGGTYQLSLSMRAPDSSGQYSETWAIVQGDTNVCQVYNIIQVR